MYKLNNVLENGIKQFISACSSQKQTAASILEKKKSTQSTTVRS